MPYPKNVLSHQQVRKLKAISKNQRTKEGPINAPKPIRGLPFQNTRSQANSQPDLPSSFDLEQVHPDEVLAQLNDDQLDFLEDEDDFFDAPTSPPPMPKKNLSTKKKSTPAGAAVIQREKDTVRDRSPVAGPSRQLTPPPSSQKYREAADTPLPADDSDDEVMPATQRQSNVASGGAPQNAMSNMFYEGFGEYTSPSGQVFVTYKKSYKKSFKCVCTFQGTQRAEAYLKDTQDTPVYINHGGNTFPYWFRRASCNDEEFNQPDNVLGFRCRRMGFSVPRLELATIPNNKTSENEVPMPTPMHAEMWTFMDSNGDYGVPVRDENGGQPHIMPHNDAFTNYFHGEIPEQVDRLQVWDKDMLLNLNRDNVTYNKEQKELTIASPYDIYDLKMHPGYRSVPATEPTAFAMDFEPAEMKWTFFPHVQVSSMDGQYPAVGTIDAPDYEGYSLEDDNNGNVAQWPVNYISTPVDQAIDRRAATTVNKVRMVHLANHYGGFSDTTSRWRNPKRTYLYQEATDNTFKPKDIGLDPNLGGYSTTVYNVAGLTSEGDTNLFQKFPQFIFGVHPDYERKANSILPYNYFANLNVTYFSEVEWLLATPTPSYLPIGPGGCDGRTQSDRDTYNGKGFLIRQMRRRNRRRVLGHVKGNFFVGPNYV
ncbi:hypothetical protein RRG08_062850 [Elysia crispata]|uniref:Uncharacterized protein n=1 Tax=Elysia crispata TaxID=231223 RepID=A0AAE0Z9N8_9GAST|nr:hypothetical protein RRG08_062850 [Elysia crispata]